MIIGTAGHIDHGKTTLVKALTGVDCDRLKEEKARGITLDLGYAYADDGRLGFVDVPGHERLVHNMLAGATGIDFVLLVVAADDGPMPQTREHLGIVDLLGLHRGAVALTKIDAVSDERRAQARAEIPSLLEGTSLQGAPLFEVSATQGEGVDALRSYLSAASAELVERQAAGGFRLAIDRCFTLQGIGLVVTGTAFSGKVATGDAVVVTPPGFPARVRGLHAQDRSAMAGGAGERLALNLTGDFGKEDIGRGMWVTLPVLHTPVQRLHGRLRVLPAEGAPLKHWTPVHVHHGAADISGRIALLEGDALAPGEAMLAEILLERPVGALWGDRFILRDQSATRTIGGGRVLDIFPPSRHKRAPERLEYLRLLHQSDPKPALEHALQRQPAGVDLDRYALNRNVIGEQARHLWRDMGLMVIETAVGSSGFSPQSWQVLRERLLAAAHAEHERTPDMIGVERDRLRRLVLPALPRAAFDQLVGELLAGGELAQSGSWLHLPEHRAQLAASDTDLWRTLQPLLERVPYAPPRVRDIARDTGVPEDTVRRLLRRVARVGQAYPVAHDHYFTAEAVADLAGRIANLCARDGAARAAALRDEIGGGRKLAIHILEFFDRVGYTRRVGDTHVLRGAAVEQHWII
jgi:selenocysteine-specific elongation factor